MPGFAAMRSLSAGAERLMRYLLAALLVTAGLPVLGALVPNASAELDLLAQFLVQGLALAALVLLMSLLTRRRRGVLAALALLLAGGLVLAPHLGLGRLVLDARAHWAGADRPVPPVHLYFHNVWAANSDLATTFAQARASDADVLLFAESGPARWRRLVPLFDSHPHHISCAGRSECDLTLLSRLPIDDQVTFHDRQSGGRGIAATVDGGAAGRLRVVSIHLARPIRPESLDVQLRQVEALLRSDLFRADLPTVLIGDFNAVPWATVVGRFANGLQLRPAGGIEGSWPAFLPGPLRIRIDQALVSPEIAVRAQRLEQGGGSDHRALSLHVGGRG
ncbi:endonuclease/exonuclease/phosphatase family protein [Geminicoccus flavidas]|uniref:endonuclease/exonuclease/phosphatase family protein n=1 Tax=Geminicoccus flavidas TaxID=2506407 RepID=UPI00135A3E1E|nr:endonuclease/exonuclease/phosphatase family protein [Geminicoccus flavidas]